MIECRPGTQRVLPPTIKPLSITKLLLDRFQMNVSKHFAVLVVAHVRARLDHVVLAQVVQQLGAILQLCIYLQ